MEEITEGQIYELEDTTCLCCDANLVGIVKTLPKNGEPYLLIRCPVNPLHAKGFVHWDHQFMRFDPQGWKFSPNGHECPVCKADLIGDTRHTRRTRRQFYYVYCSELTWHLKMYCHAPKRIKPEWFSSSNQQNAAGPEEADHE